MPGYVTTTRFPPNQKLYAFEWWNGVNDNKGPDLIGSWLPSYVPVQTTTSWRTGGRIGKEVDDVLDNLDGAQNELQAVQAIAKDTRDYSNTFDRGHTFDTKLQSIEFSNPGFFYWDQFGNGHAYVGPLMQNPGFLHRSPFSAGEASDTNWYGTQAIRNTIPTNPLTNLAVSLGEIYKDGLPHLPNFMNLFDKGYGFVKNLAEEYLNFQFGWKPTVADTASAMSAVDRSNTAVKQFMRDNGKTVRRSFSFPMTRSTQLWNDAGSTLYDPTQTLSGMFTGGSTGTMTETLLTTQEISFKGAYSYYLPIGSSELDRLERFASRAQLVSGLEITPEVLWNLAPWSWFGSWLSDIGSIVHNVSQFSQDGLVLRYGYLMVTTTTIHTSSLNGIRFHNGPTLGPQDVVYTTIRKQRFKATPYGFGLNPNSFTDSQWSILGALGLSRGPGHLRSS